VVLALVATEKAIERATGRRVAYQRPRKARPPRPEPGGETPLPASEAPERLAERRLPIPPPPDKEQRAMFLPGSSAPALPPPTIEPAPQKSLANDFDAPAEQDTSGSATTGPADVASESETGDDDSELYYEDLEDIP